MSLEYYKIGPSVGVSHSFVAHADKNRTVCPFDSFGLTALNREC